MSICRNVCVLYLNFIKPKLTSKLKLHIHICQYVFGDMSWQKLQAYFIWIWMGSVTCFKIYMSSVFVCNVNLSCECVSCNSFFHHHNRLQIIRSSFIYVSFVFLWYVFWVGCQDGGYYWLTPWNCDVNWFCRFCFGQRGGLMTEIQMWCPV